MGKDVQKDRAYDSISKEIIFIWKLDEYYNQLKENESKKEELKKFNKTRKTRYLCMFCDARYIARLEGEKESCFAINTRGPNGKANEKKCTESCKLNARRGNVTKTVSEPTLKTTSDPELEFEADEINELVDTNVVSSSQPRIREFETDTQSSGTQSSQDTSKTSNLVKVVQYFLQDPEERKDHPLTVSSEGVRNIAKTYAAHFTFLDVEQGIDFYKKHIFFGHLSYSIPAAMEIDGDDIVFNILKFRGEDEPVQLRIDRTSPDWPEDKIVALRRTVNTAYKHMAKMQFDQGAKGYVTIFALAEPSFKDNHILYVEKFDHFYMLGSEKLPINKLKKSVNRIGTFKRDPDVDNDLEGDPDSDTATSFELDTFEVTEVLKESYRADGNIDSMEPFEANSIEDICKVKGFDESSKTQEVSSENTHKGTSIGDDEPYFRTLDKESFWERFKKLFKG